MDLSSAYDLVDHKLLLEKCRHLAMGTLTLKWIESYLKDRYHYVEVNGVKSHPLEMGDNGVIQGAPSSGDFFLMFLNNLPDMGKSPTEKIHTKSKQFVDDINSVIKAKSNSELMARTLKEYQRLERNLINHKMKINGDKTQLMCIKPDAELKN